MDAASEIADALGVVLGRGFRVELYAELTRDVHTGFSAATYPALSGVARRGPMSVSALAAMLGLDRSVVSRTAHELSRHGLVEARRSEQDSRVVLLSLTRAGAESIAISRLRLAEAVRLQLDGWPAHEQELFARLLTRFTESERLGRPSDRTAQSP